MSSTKKTKSFNSDLFWQYIIALDVRFNSERCLTNHSKILYIKRRNQLFRELSKSDLNNFRKRYLKLRYLILTNKYRENSPEQKHKIFHSRTGSDTSFLSFIYNDLLSLSNVVPNGSFEPTVVSPLNRFQANVEPRPPSSGDCSYSFSGVYHIFDQHKDSVNSIKFANRDASILALASSDGTLSICQLIPAPVTILFALRGHKGPVANFEWSRSNDLIASCSMDASLRLWSTKNGTCLRVFRDPQGYALLACTFYPRNNNMIVMANSHGWLNILNLSTGIFSKNCVHVCEGPVWSLCFQLDADLLWVGDCKGLVSTFRFEMEQAKLVLINRVIIVAACPITSLSTYDGEDMNLLLANCASNALVLFKHNSRSSTSPQLEFVKSFPVHHSNPGLILKSSICPQQAASKKLSVCLVTGSEDTSIYIYTFEQCKTSPSSSFKCVNKLQGHSSPVIDVCFNHDGSLLASADAKGNVIVWKRESNLLSS